MVVVNTFLVPDEITLEYAIGYSSFFQFTDGEVQCRKTGSLCGSTAQAQKGSLEDEEIKEFTGVEP